MQANVENKVTFLGYVHEGRRFLIIEGASLFVTDFLQRMEDCESSLTTLIRHGRALLTMHKVEPLPELDVSSETLLEDMEQFSNQLLLTGSKIGQRLAERIQNCAEKKAAIVTAIETHGHVYTSALRGSRRVAVGDARSCECCGTGIGVVTAEIKPLLICPLCEAKTYCDQACFRQDWRRRHKVECPRTKTAQGHQFIRCEAEIAVLARAIGGYDQCEMMSEEEFLHFLNNAVVPMLDQL